MITVEQLPAIYTQVYSQDGANLGIVVDSTTSNQCSFKYVSDVWINGQYVNRLRVSPTLINGKGVVSLHRVIEDFVSYDFRTGPTAIQNMPNSIARWDVEIGQESDGTIDCSGSSTIFIPGPTVTGWSWNATVQYDEAREYDSFAMGPSAGSASFLTNSPKDQTIGIEEPSYLYWLSDMGASGGATSGTLPFVVQIQTTSVTGSTAAYWILLDTDIEPAKIYSVAVGPSQINQFASDGKIINSLGIPFEGPLIDCTTKQYDVTLTNLITLGP